jgi:hypothetical protein
VDRALNREEWQPLADALAQATKTFGLKCDRAVTIDSARVLRVPDTFNYKNNEKRPVKLLGIADDYTVERLWRALEPHRTAPKVNGYAQRDDFMLDPELFKNPRRPINGYTNELSAGIETHDDVMPEDELRMCVDAIPNPGTEWNAWNNMGMRIYAATEGADYGLAEWERWSAKNPDGNVNDKDTCSDRWETYKTSPPTRTGGGALVNAARAALGDPKWMPRSKLAQVTAAVSSGIVLPPLPVGYTRDILGRVCIQVQDPVTKRAHDQLLFPYPINEAFLQDGDTGMVLVFDTVLKGMGARRVRLNTSEINGIAMRASLQSQGVMVPARKSELEPIGEFMASWVTTLQQSKAFVQSKSFGWETENGVTQGFIFGEQLWTPNGGSPAGSPHPVTARHYKPTGSIDPWIAAAKLITDQDRPALQVMLATAFAGPLVKFTNEPGCVVSGYSSESGIGKSTVMKIAQAVWGDPVKGMVTLDDTMNSSIGTMEALRSIPLYYDEVKGDDAMRNLVKLIFRVSQAKGKARMARDASQRELGEWQTLMVTASNDSLLHWVMQNTSTTLAGMYRILSFPVRPMDPCGPGVLSTAEASRIIGKVHHNYGLVGLEYAKWLGANFATIDPEIFEYHKQLEREFNSLREERFWMASCAAILKGAEYANRLGWTKFDLVSMKRFLFDTLNDLRGVKKTESNDLSEVYNVKIFINQFINAMRGHNTLITNKVKTGPGKPTKGEIKVMCDTMRLGAIHVQRGLEDDIIRLSVTKLGQWLSEQGKSRALIMERAKAPITVGGLGGRVITGGRLGSGTGDPRVTCGTEYLLELDASSVED